MTQTSPRRGYRNDIGFGWLLEQAIRCCRNLVHNWQESMDDSDVFCLFANSPHFGKKDLKDLVLNHFGPDAPFFEGEPGVPVPERPARNGKSKRVPELPEGDDPLAKAVRRMQKRRMRLRDCGGMADTILDIWNCEAHRPACRAMLEEACDLLLAREHRANRKRPADPLEARVDAIASFLGLDPVARDVFVYAAVRDMTHYGALPRRLRTPQERIDFIAMATDRPDSEVARALRADAPLRRFEVLDEDTDLVHGTPIWECLQNGGETLIESRFYKRTALDDALPLSFHGALAERHAAILKALLAAPAPAAANGHAPNILFYGPPGTGKTSFAKTLVRELGYDLVEIRQGDANGHISPTARFTGIRLCNEHFPAGRVVVLVDEADELLGTVGEGLFGFLSRDHGRKGVVNATLDDAKLPAIWIANTPADALDESVRRRFAYSIRFEPLDGQKRLAIWRNTVGRLGLDGTLPSETVGRLSSRYPVNAGGIATALESLKRIGPAPEEVEQTLSALLEPHCELLGIRVRDEAAADSADYSVEGLNVVGEISPERVLAAVRKFRGEGARSCASPDRPRLNILLYGPPGTGKTEFVRHLARESGARLDLLTGSSLLGPYVGETEARIRPGRRQRLHPVPRRDGRPDDGPRLLPPPLGTDAGQRAAARDGRLRRHLRRGDQLHGPSRPGGAAAVHVQTPLRVPRHGREAPVLRAHVQGAPGPGIGGPPGCHPLAGPRRLPHRPPVLPLPGRRALRRPSRGRPGARIRPQAPVHRRGEPTLRVCALRAQ
ncbi:MAG: ATP-binding protein [Kiritimatiellae bacterium]|nr:ATP-binding protein [Kiritimatiellia bacterium]